MLTIAALITCHNRKNVTLAALAALVAATPDHVKLITFLVDDGSSDGTTAAVCASHPDVRIIEGDGTLFWNAAMRLAWKEAAVLNPEFFLWLNDDLALRSAAVSELLAAYHAYAPSHTGRVIVVGKTRSPDTGEVTYGGYRRASGLSRIRWRRLSGDEVFCDTMNGNCVLVPRQALDEIGLPSERYRHAFGDIDYGIRARRSGYVIVECHNPVGLQSRNFQLYSGGRVRLSAGNIAKVLFHPKGVPVLEWWHFCRTHAGPLWPVNFSIRYVKIFLNYKNRAEDR